MRKITTPFLSTPFLSTTLALSVAVAAPPSWADEGEFKELRPIIEINATDGDAGFQVFIDGEEWRQVRIEDPNGQLVYEVTGSGSVQTQGLTENFFESAEPTCDELPLSAFLDRFPAGEYVFTGMTIRGDQLEDAADLTHALPAAPENLSPDGVGGVDPAGVTITWTAGDGLGKCPPDGVTIEPPGDVELFGYEVIVERDDPEPEIGFTAVVPASVTSLTLPPQFVQAGAVYKFEIIAIEVREDDEKGNQTVVESFFCTAPIATDDCEVPD